MHRKDNNKERKKEQSPLQPVSHNPNTAAREEAMKDIDQDADLSIHSPNDDLDEGETARLGEDKTGLV